MADIFVSHSEQDRGVAQTLAKFLGGLGWTVSWDKTPLSDDDRDNTSMAELVNTQLVIVIWSKSCTSRTPQLLPNQFPYTVEMNLCLTRPT